MLLLFGYALSLDVDRIPTVIYDLDRTSVSDALIKDFRGSRYFQIVDDCTDYHPIEQAMDIAPRAAGRRDSERLFEQSGRGQDGAGAVAAGRKRLQHRLHRHGLRRRIDSNLRAAPAARRGDVSAPAT